MGQRWSVEYSLGKDSRTKLQNGMKVKCGEKTGEANIVLALSLYSFTWYTWVFRSMLLNRASLLQDFDTFTEKFCDFFHKNEIFLLTFRDFWTLLFWICQKQSYCISGLQFLHNIERKEKSRQQNGFHCWPLKIFCVCNFVFTKCTMHL